MKKIYIWIIIIIILIVAVIGGYFAFNRYFIFDNQQEEIPDNEFDEEMLFNDVPVSHKASEAINFLTQRNIMNVSGDEKFYPDKTVSEGEFVKILATASLNSANFKDISGDDYLKYAEVLEKYNILKKEDIDVNKYISKSKVAVLVAKADMKIKKQDQMITELNYSDLNEIDEVTQTLIGHSIARGFVLPDNAKNYNPNANMTRSEIATIIYTFINS